MSHDKQEISIAGEELVSQGLADLARNLTTESSLLVLIAAPRLRRLGVEVPDVPAPRPVEQREKSRQSDS
jgi:hypothetical protein